MQGYAAGLVDQGILANPTVRLLVIPVDGTYADWWVWEDGFDRSVADAYADLLAQVEAARAAGERLPRDKPHTWCERFCLTAETEVVTRDGIRMIGDLAGGMHSLLVPSRQVNGITWHGQWIDCEVKSFGVQSLMALTLRRGRQLKTVYATAEHRWFTEDADIVTTRALSSGIRLRSIRRNSTSVLAEVPVAVAQEFVYGDGSAPHEQHSRRPRSGASSHSGRASPHQIDQAGCQGTV